MYQPPSEDFTTADRRVQEGRLRGLHRAPDAAGLHQLLDSSARSRAISPRSCSMSKALLFHQSIEAVGDIGIGTVRPHGLASHVPVQELSHRPDLPGVRRSRTTAETGEQWTQPLGQLGKYEWAVDVLKRVTDIENKEPYVDVIKTTKFEGINGPVDFNLPVSRAPSARSPTCARSRSPAASGTKAEGSKFKYDIYICFGQDPNMPVEKKFGDPVRLAAEAA